METKGMGHTGWEMPLLPLLSKGIWVMKDLLRSLRETSGGLVSSDLAARSVIAHASHYASSGGS